MKKQIKKLSLNKKTISNLSATEMSKHVGGRSVLGYGCGGNGTWVNCGNSKNCTQNQNTCQGHNTCNNC